MSVRVGHIMRHEDVHGVSGEGKVADVFEASNGKAVVVWTSATPSVSVFDSIKALEVPHQHGGKTEVIWVWEEEPDPDPMDRVIEKKVAEAAGNNSGNGADGALGEATDKMANGVVKDVLTSAAKKLTDLATESSEEGGGEEGSTPPKKEAGKAPKKATAVKKTSPKRAGDKKG